MRYDYDYVIIGAGMAADSAARGIRSKDPDGSIVLLGQDTDPPYERPPLTKNLWTDPHTSESDLLLGTRAATGAHVHTGTRVTEVDRAEKLARVSTGDVFTFRKLLFATGSVPRRLNLAPAPDLIYFRYLTDYHRLRALAQPGAEITLLGGGYIGTELACSLARNNVNVTLAISDKELFARAFPQGLRKRLTQVFTDNGITIRTGSHAAYLERGADPGIRVHFKDHSSLLTPALVAGLGAEPDTGLAATTGLTLSHGGVVVDDRLRTSSPFIYAAGDIAVYPDKILGRRRVEHVDQAQASGYAAGRNMAGADEPYEYTPLFFSDLFDDGYEAVGLLDTRLDLVEDWAPGAEHERGVVYYLKHGGLRGVLLWNVWDQADRARELLRELRSDGSVHGPKDVRGRIPFD